MNPDVSNIISQFSEILKEKNINLDDILSTSKLQNSNINSSNMDNTKSGETPISEEESTISSSNVDNPSKILELLQNFFNDSSFSQDSSDTKRNKSNNNSGFDFNNIDIDTILKIQSIMSKLNDNNDPKNRLLLSLKPFLKNSRQNKIDQYIQILNMLKIANEFGFLGGENRNG